MVASRRLSADVCACGHTIAANALHDVKPSTDVCEIIHKCAIAAYRKHCYDEKDTGVSDLPLLCHVCQVKPDVKVCYFRTKTYGGM